MAANNQADNTQAPVPEAVPGISFISKEDKLTNSLRDCLRLMAWKEFKRSYKGDLRGLNLYALFEQQWTNHAVQTMSQEDLIKFIEGLGYTVGEMIAARSEHYKARDAWRAANGYGDGNTPSTPARPSNNQPDTQPDTSDAGLGEEPPF